LENASAYSPPGSTISVRLAVRGASLQVAVRDRGRGLPSGQAGRVGDRGVEHDEASREKFGSGLGLAITHGLITTLGGRVWAENHPDGGAVFTLEIPVEIRDAAELAEETV
jgi:K+-sensing histidine kinase KdpD